MTTYDYNYPRYARLIHAGLAILGIAAWLTGEIAEDGIKSTGYLVHAYLGLSLAFFIVMRIVTGLGSKSPMSLSGWSPFSSHQWTLAIADVRNLIRLQVPERGMHEGLAGLTQSFGLMLFGWMAATGTGLFFLDSGREATLLEIIEELHEVGEALIPVYLALHVGSVVVHSVAGKPIWQRMWSFRS